MKNYWHVFQATLRGISCIALFLACQHLSWAQHNQYIYHNIDQIRSNEVIKGITKDAQGFIWLATDEGILRFDGRTTTSFRSGLSSLYGKKFLNTDDGQLLLLTDQEILEVVNQRDTTFFKPLGPFENTQESINYPKSIYEDKDGTLWIGEFNTIVKIGKSGVKRFALDRNFQSISYHRSFSFCEDAFHNLWIAAYNGQLLKYDKEKDVLKEISLKIPLTDVSTIFSVNGDNIWLGGKEGLYKFRVDSDDKISDMAFIPGPENISTGFYIDNQVYVGTWDNGLHRASSQLFPYQFSQVDGIPFNDIVDQYLDNSRQEIWITGSENVGVLKPAVIKKVQKVGKSRVETMTMDLEKNIFFSNGQQIFSLSQQNKEEATLVYASKQNFVDRMIWQDHKLWMGYAFGGIAVLNLEDKTVNLIKDDNNNAVKYILEDKKGNKWFTGDPLGVVKVSHDNAITLYDGVKNSVAIRENTQGEIFCSGLGNDGLVYRYDPDRNDFQSLPYQYQFKAKAAIFIEDIAFDSLGNVWLASDQGLLSFQLHDDEYQVVRIEVNGLQPDEHYKAIAIFNDIIYLAHAQGLILFRNQQSINYTPQNGLPSRLIKERGLSVKDDKLYINTAKGLAFINLSQPTFKQTASPIFKALLVNGARQAGVEAVELSYGSRIVAEFTSPAYPGNNLVYQTKIIGLDKEWSDPSSNTSISVLGFTEGNYSISVRARDDGSLWSDATEVSFIIAAPWYKAWWVIGLALIAFVLVIVGTIKLYYLNLIRQKKKLKLIIENRTREINLQKNEIIEQQNKIIHQKEELLEKKAAVFNTQKALSEADLNYLHLKKKQLDDQIEYRNKQITTHTLKIIQKNEMLKGLWDQLELIINTPDGVSQKELRKLQKTIDDSFRHDKDWDEFKIYFEQVFTGFYAKLKVNYPDLSNQELRHCALIRLNLRTAECASVLGISAASIKVTRNRLKKKLNLQPEESLGDFLISF